MLCIVAPLTPPPFQRTPAKVLNFSQALTGSVRPWPSPPYAICGILGDIYLNGFWLRLFRFGEMERENALFKDSLNLRVVHHTW